MTTEYYWFSLEKHQASGHCYLVAGRCGRLCACLVTAPLSYLCGPVMVQLSLNLRIDQNVSFMIKNSIGDGCTCDETH